MNIGIDGRAAKWYRGTGIGTNTHQLISNINKIDKLNQYLLFLPKNSDLELNENFTINPIEESPNNNFWDEVNAPNILNNTDIELYHVPQNGVGLASNINCLKAITLHDIIPLRMPETVSDRYLNIFHNHLPQIIQNCDGIITVSEFSKDDIAREFNYPKEKIFVTHLAAEDIYIPLNKSYCKNFLKSKYNIDKNFILYVGGYSPRKNIIGILEAFSLLDESIKNNLYVVITGKKGISYSIYMKRAEDLGIENSVIFTDFIPLEHLPIFYNASEFLVYPSFYEGFGLPPLEAMACGTPVIASNVTSIPEICSDSALLIDPNNIDDLSLSMNKLLDDNSLRLSMIEAGLKTSNKYSWINTAKDTIKAYKSIINSYK